MNDNHPPLPVIEYGKLVTDDKIGLIKAEGGWYESRELAGAELLEYIGDKLTEESEEVAGATQRGAQLQELAGLIILLEKYRETVGISEAELAQAINERVGKGQIYETNTLLEKATAPTDGHKVNSVKEDYVLVIMNSSGNTERFTIAAVTDRAARRKAQTILAKHGDVKTCDLAKQLKL